MTGSPFAHTIDEYLHVLSSSKPTPGGGSTSAVVAALGAAIALMAARISDRNEDQVDIQQRVQRLKQHRDEFEKLCQEDMESFQRVMNALERKKDEEQLQQVIALAAAVPLRLAKECCSAMVLCEELIDRIQKNVLSDLGCAVFYLNAACQGALLTMNINTRYLKDHEQSYRLQQEGQAVRKESNAKCNEILFRIEEEMSTISGH
ncbi:cyclodeaminase/cyclohydrolase family protein [Ammoniphilus sp. 3BR4]|uniref:cyclodeaminase/cyclohydrolase family protein n=1 Tax=Ammoniphilus sp. 3BR4 TaxID=3158265 RepID=UPI00346615EA